MNPIKNNGFSTREDAQDAVRALFDPLREHFSDGQARLQLEASAAKYPRVDAEFEGYCRPLWGIVPLAAGGGSFDHWRAYRQGLANGTNPDHPEYWGDTPETCQKHVEMATIGFALATVPERLWDPLSEASKANVSGWLGQINDVDLFSNNWLYFRVLTNLGLDTVGADTDWELVGEDLDRLESYYRGDGWYGDGPDGGRDYYNPWAMHTYGLLYVTLHDDVDPERERRIRERAATFAEEFRHWFDENGAGLPYGRSLTYRFAQAAFWGALAVADLEALPWSEIRGLWARNLRWWSDQPIFTTGGTLSVGYRYPSLKMSEIYNSPCGPYWAMKAFLPLACPPEHSFWAAEEAEAADRPSVVEQPEPSMLICDDETSDHHFALCGGQAENQGEKYTKFTTSTSFGFSVRDRHPTLDGAGHDGAIAIRRASDTAFRIRTSVEDAHLTDDGLLYSAWSLWDGFQAGTWLAPALPWHVRVHRIETTEAVELAEGGFALDRTGDDRPTEHEHSTDDGIARATYPAGESGLRDLLDERTGDIVDQSPNTNLLHPRTVVPTLRGEFQPGTHWLVTAATGAPASGEDGWDRPPEIEETAAGYRVYRASGDQVLDTAEFDG